jgi:hypothetical protein
LKIKKKRCLKKHLFFFADFFKKQAILFSLFVPDISAFVGAVTLIERGTRK